MIRLNRREFIQASTASLLLNSVKVSASPGNPAKVDETAKGVQVKGENYTWEWSQADDRFRLLDKQGLVMTSGILQPAVIVQRGTNKQARKCTPGRPATHTTKDGSFTVNYAGVNGNGKLTVTWRFEDDALWLDPIVYESSEPENVVALHYFAQGTGEDARPTLDNFYLSSPRNQRIFRGKPDCHLGFGFETHQLAGTRFVSRPRTAPTMGIARPFLLRFPS